MMVRVESGKDMNLASSKSTECILILGSVADNIWRGAGEPSIRTVSHVRLTSPSFASRQSLFNKMHNMMGTLLAAVQLNSTPVIICDHPFILCL